MAGKTLKRLREQTGYTQKSIGEALGLTTSMIGMYETDVRNPSYETLMRMADYFKT